ncbi:MAG: hypothetical protein B6244_04610 [Candidatus Cloacimonetes bacterium 4572_55]|nr:MAG: hypothetical protein B6244_04610 [Candidatus Cloacimonetes bacterium 4572_55]
MHRIIDMNTWKRKPQFDFFKEYDDPFFNICSNVSFKKCHDYAKEKNRSIFLATLFSSLKAANSIEEFRCRIVDDQAVIYDVIHAGSTILNEDETFSFCYFDYFPEFDDFLTNAQQILERNRKQRGLDPQDHRTDLVYYSLIPWISFTGINHARRFNSGESIPKIVFGKFSISNDDLMLPVSIEAHHSFVDGLHVAKYLDLFQKYLSHPEEWLT